MIHFYGSPMSSAGRTHWMLEETGVPYEYHRVNLRDAEACRNFARVFPAAKVPFLIDGDVHLFESMAINFYLAEKYAPALMPPDPVQRAKVYQWSFWAITNLQPEAMAYMTQMFLVPEGERDAKRIESSGRAAQHYVAQLEEALGGEFLLGDRFSVGDVNVASVVNLAVRAGAAPGGPRLLSWLDRMRARPGYQAAAKEG